MKIEVNGTQVEVGEEFAKLSPDKQQAVVEEIAASLAPAPKAEDELGDPSKVNELWPALGGAAFGAIKGKDIGKAAQTGIEATKSALRSSGLGGENWLRNWAGMNRPGVQGVPEASQIYNRAKTHGKAGEKVWQKWGAGPLDISRQAEIAEKQKRAASLPGQIVSGAKEAGKAMARPTPYRFLGGALAGGLTGYDAARAWNRLQEGDIPGAAISGIGALGGALSFIPHPLTRVGGAGLAGGAAMLDLLRDKNKDYENIDAETSEEPSWQGYRAGGLARLADGGSTPKGGSPKKRVAEFVIGKAPRAIKDILESKQAPMLRPSGEGPLLPQVSNPYIAELPDVLPQKRLTRGTNPRMERLQADPRAYEAIEKAMQHGVNIDPKLAYWYGTNRLLTGMQNEGSTFEDFDRLMKHMASASQRNPVPQQNKMGSLLNYLDVTGQLGAPGTPLQLPKGYGSLAQSDIVKRAQEIGAGQYPFDDAIKLGKFYKSYMGYHPENAVVDVIGTRVPTMATRDPEWLAKSVKMGNKKEGFQILNPRDMFARGELTMEEALKRPGFWTAAPEKVGEYAGIEDMWKGVAKGQGYKSGEGQALGWYGSAGLDDTAGLKSKPMTWEESLEQRARERAKETGRHPLDVMTDFLQLKGHLKQGGPVHLAKGGDAAKKLAKMVLPPAENAARTQIIGTLPTYRKAADIFKSRGAEGRGLDFGAGLGEGAKVMPGRFETYEPFASGWTPTYSDISQIPEEAYNRLTNLNVLNVVPREMRDEIVQGIGRSMEPGGTGIITTRGKDVMSAKGRPGPEPMSIITGINTYQKGFTNPELQEYLKYMLGEGYDIERLGLGPAGAVIRKKAEGGLAHLAKGGKTPAWQRKEGQNPEGGLNAAGRASYKRETGGELKRPQPEGGPRRDSFCARMKGMKKKLTSAETANDPDSRINKSLRAWNC